MLVVRVSTKGQIVIPKDVRNQLEIEPRTYISARTNEGDLTLTPIGADPVEAGYGALAHLGPMTPVLLRGRREELELEEQKTKWPPKPE